MDVTIINVMLSKTKVTTLLNTTLAKNDKQ